LFQFHANRIKFKDFQNALFSRLPFLFSDRPFTSGGIAANKLLMFSVRNRSFVLSRRVRKAAGNCVADLALSYLDTNYPEETQNHETYKRVRDRYERMIDIAKKGNWKLKNQQMSHHLLYLITYKC
jgi:hypothetical protein